MFDLLSKKAQLIASEQQCDEKLQKLEQLQKENVMNSEQIQKLTELNTEQKNKLEELQQNFNNLEQQSSNHLLIRFLKI